MNKNNRSTGFTLIELLIVVVIIAILAAVGYPVYNEHIKKSRRRDAQATLMELSNAMERLHTRCSSYSSAVLGGNGTDCSSNGVFPNKAPLDGNRKYYSLSFLETPNTSAWKAMATPIGGQAGDGCLLLFSTGERCWLAETTTCTTSVTCSTTGAVDW